MYCGEQCLVKRELNKVGAVSLRCRSWTCELCHPVRKAQLVAQCHRGAPTTFLTLTIRRKPGAEANKAALELTRAWRILRLRILRKYRIKKLPFAAIMEATKAGWPHLHILLRSIWIDQRWLSEQMQDIADSPTVFIERIDNKARVNAYVAKYCGKAAHKFGTAKRYYFSQDYMIADAKKQKPLFDFGAGWDREPYNLRTWCKNWKEFGWRVTVLSDRHATAERIE